jgi:hypothetical protein
VSADVTILTAENGVGKKYWSLPKENNLKTRAQYRALSHHSGVLKWQNDAIMISLQERLYVTAGE